MTWYEIFPRILNMNLTASLIIVFIMILRLFLKRAPKVYSYVIWSVVLFRLLCPVSISAPVSILGVLDAPVIESTADKSNAEVVTASRLEYIPSNIVHEEDPEITLPVPFAGDMISEAINESLPQRWEETAFDPLEASILIATYLWMSGILCWLVYGVVSYLKLRQRLVGAMQFRDNIYLADHIQSPFVLGILRPRIYMPSDLDEKEQCYIILHEQHHIRRGDHIVKMLSFAALCIHWINPLVWVAFLLSAKDMEMSCDEAVVKKLGEDIRADYAVSLLQLATGKRILFGTPLAFGEGEPAGRIRNLAHFKRPTIVVTILAAFACVVGIILCVFNPAVSYDSMKVKEIDTSAVGKRVEYEVDLGVKVRSATIFAEQWSDGICTRSSAVTLSQDINELSILMKERKNNGELTGIDIQIDTNEAVGSLAGYLTLLPEGHSVTGWAFKAYEENERLRVEPGEEKILAAVVFDEGNGVRVFDCDLLVKEPQRLEDADRMIVIRAIFQEEVVEEKYLTQQVDFNYETDQTTNPEGVNAVKLWMEQFGAELDENIYYVTALEKLEIGRLLPDGSDAYVSEGEAFGNSVDFQDIDMDGSKELLLNVGGTCMADMGLYVYQLDESLTGVYEFRQELLVWPAATFYTNGIVTAKLSHNHGYSDNNEFWPYDIYAYDKENDVYIKVWSVDAWEKCLVEVDFKGTVFPDLVDTDEDGMIYRISTEEDGEVILLDKEAYEEWFAELIKGADEIPVMLQFTHQPRHEKRMLACGFSCLG